MAEGPHCSNNEQSHKALATLLGAIRDHSCKFGIRGDLQVFDVCHSGGTPKGETVICDPRREIEVGCQAVLVYSDNSAVLVTIEHITPKQWVIRVGKDSHKQWKEWCRLLRVVDTSPHGVLRAVEKT